MSENNEDMEVLITQFSKLGAQFTLNYAIKFIEKIEEHYPKVPKDKFLELAIETFKENNIPIEAKIPTSRQKIKDEDRCSKILKTGKNKGMRCSLQKTANSNYCKRHSNQTSSQILTSSTGDKMVISNYLKLLQPKSSPTPLELIHHKEKNIALHKNTNIVFNIKDDKYTAIGTYVQNDDGAGVVKLSEIDIAICKEKHWEYEE